MPFSHGGLNRMDKALGTEMGNLETDIVGCTIFDKRGDDVSELCSS